MTQEEFVERVQQRVAQVASNRLARAYNGIALDLVETIFDYIAERVRAGEEIHIAGFGKFIRRSIMGKKRPGPKGCVARSPGYARVGFKASKKQRWPL